MPKTINVLLLFATDEFGTDVINVLQDLNLKSNRYTYASLFNYKFVLCDVSLEVPTLQRLREYDLLFVDTSSTFLKDSVGLGNVIAQYFLERGALVLCCFTNCSKHYDNKGSTVELQGKFKEWELHPMNHSAELLESQGEFFLHEKIDPAHPILQHVQKTFSGGSYSGHIICQARDESKLLATWANKEQTVINPLVVERTNFASSYKLIKSYHNNNNNNIQQQEQQQDQQQQQQQDNSNTRIQFHNNKIIVAINMCSVSSVGASSCWNIDEDSGTRLFCQAVQHVAYYTSSFNNMIPIYSVLQLNNSVSTAAVEKKNNFTDVTLYFTKWEFSVCTSK